MSQITIDKTTFDMIALSATKSTTDVYDSLADYIEVSTNIIVRDFLGESLAEKFDTLPLTIQAHVNRAICMGAYLDAIPSLDLVLTTTGFGVVSNNTTVPASKDRVAALSESLRKTRDIAIDQLIVALQEGGVGWADDVVSRHLIYSLFWSVRHLTQYAIPSATRKELTEHRPLISMAEEIIRSKLSSRYFDSLVEAERTNTVCEADAKIIHQLRMGIGGYLAEAGCRYLHALLERVLDTLITNVDKYPVFADSDAYRASQVTPYENDKNKPTYFFG